MQHLVGQSASCVQVFAADGRCFGPPSVMPEFCATLAKTSSGSAVCNHGCGVKFPPAADGDEVLFSCCPFGVMIAATRLSSQDQTWLVGGRFFESYHHFRLFLGNAARAGAEIDEFLDRCSTLVYHDPDEIEQAMRRAAKNLVGWRPPIDLTPPPEPVPIPVAVMATGHLDAHRVELLRQFGFTLMETESLVSLSEVLLQEVKAYTQARTISLFLLDSERDELVMTNAIGLPKDAELGMRRPTKDGVLGRVCSAGRPLVVRDVGSSSAVSPSAHRHYRSNCFASFPLCAGRQALGVLSITDREIEEDFGPEEVEWVGLLTQSAAMSVDHKMMAQQLQKAQSASLIDPETRAGSRRFFDARLKEEFHRSARRNHPLSLVLIQVETRKDAKQSSPEDKQAQDTAMLRGAKVVTSILRNFDMVARYDGNVFAVLLPETTRKACEIAVGRIDAALQEAQQVARAQEPESSTTARYNFGIADYPGDASTIADLKRVAEHALASSVEGDFGGPRITIDLGLLNHPVEGVGGCIS